MKTIVLTIQPPNGSNLKIKSVFFFLRNFFDLFMFGHFSGREGGLPFSKLFEELFCLHLDIFQERGRGLPDSKNDEERFFALTWTCFKENLGG